MSSFLLNAQNAIIFLTGSTFIYVQKRKSYGQAVHLGARPPCVENIQYILITEKKK